MFAIQARSFLSNDALFASLSHKSLTLPNSIYILALINGG